MYLLSARHAASNHFEQLSDLLGRITGGRLERKKRNDGDNDRVFEPP